MVIIVVVMTKHAATAFERVVTIEELYELYASDALSFGALKRNNFTWLKSNQ